MSTTGYRHYAIGLAPAMPEARYRLANPTDYFNGRTT